MKKSFWILLAIFLSAAVVAEESKLNVGAGVGIWKYDEADVPGYTLGSLDLSVAYDVMENLAIQANAGFGLSSETESIGSGPLMLETKIRNYLSLYLRPQYKLEKVSLYVLLGYSSVKAEETLTNLQTDASESNSGKSSGMSYGVGVQVPLSDSGVLSIDYKQQGDSSDFELSGVMIGYTHRI